MSYTGKVKGTAKITKSGIGELAPYEVLDLGSVVVREDGKVAVDKYGRTKFRPAYTRKQSVKYFDKFFVEIIDGENSIAKWMSKDEVFNTFGKKTARRLIREFKEVR